MKHALPTLIKKHVDYPTTDGKPMAETDLHYQVQVDSRNALDYWYEDDPWTYVSSNLLVYYEEGNPRKHLSPDLFVVKDLPKLPLREYYQFWVEGKAPDVAFEVTSKTTADEDLGEKTRIYREVWRVLEYFFFDPRAEYLDPPFQGFRRRGRNYVRIRPVEGRLPSQVLGLHVEGRDQRLRFFDPQTGTYVLTAKERLAEVQTACQQAEAEIERLRRELEELRRREQ